MMDLAPFALAGAAGLAGVGMGWLHFRGLRRVAEGLVAGQMRAVLLQVGRLALLGLFLFACAQFGPLTLIMAAAGVLAGRAFVLRQSREAAG